MARNSGAGAIGWFICGAVLGAAVALLAAPGSGKRTRRILLRQAEQGRKTDIVIRWFRMEGPSLNG